ncbi:2-hydroxyacid dehydrogenase [Silicimonas algicola]|uniref:Lactate dehydrogenase-like 2-hydroxyacid dehydrogenase n=1 Tax=Silicimonas algicola TaxID=1826607 RepID=A0A316G5D0_9RHOB|nr:2-hydroxyacid dehydrogenase [Silicimonas algicola]PWK55833.1 lactate dehydrogenase-like 2-hydroxyacid dehydrogenase [Silicimonas algicola]
MTVPKRDILVMHWLRPIAMTQLEAAYTLHRYDEAADRDAFLAEFGPRCVGIATNGHAPLTKNDLQHLPKVEIVACSSAGFEPIDVDALRERGIAFTNTSAALLDDVADTALMLTIAARRHLVRAHAYVERGDWGRKGMYPLLSTMRGKKAGIVGLGNIGRAIAARFEPLGLEIGYTSRSRKPGTYRYFPQVRDLAEWSDILAVVVPGGAETDNMIDGPVLEALGPEGTLVNVARGSVVDEPALIEALTSGKLGSAALDVFWNEPHVDPALSSLPNVTLYPHHASGTEETRDAMAQLVVDNLAAHFAGKPLLTPVHDLPAQSR